MSLTEKFMHAARKGFDKLDDWWNGERYAFFNSLREGDQPAVETFLAKKPHALFWRERVYGSKDTPLHTAARNGHAELALYLVKRGAPLEAPSACRQTPLLLALERGGVKTALALIDAGASIHAMTNQGQSVMDYAIWYGHLAVVLRLHQAGIPPQTGNDPMHAAAYMGQTDVMKFLQVNGIPPDGGDRHGHGRTPLMEAASFGKSAALQQLLDWGADYNARDAEGQTATEIAAAREYPEIAGLIEKKRATDTVKLIDAEAGAAHTGLQNNIRVRTIQLKK
ncbi:MAG: ankyrin repeat domain-containing protein [Alphaproteobacteria bacterium]